MIKVCLTGGIGSGKSFISKLFENLGIPVFNSDLCAREGENEPEIQKGFKDLLGEDIFVDGKLDRPKMRSIIFVDKEKLKLVNNIVIPYVRMKFNQFILEQHEAPYVILESAILFETGNADGFDYIITVVADKETRIKRVLERDKLTIEEINNKIKNQISDIEKIKMSDFVIVNDRIILSDDNNLQLLEKQVAVIDKAILADWVIDNVGEMIKLSKTLHSEN